MFITNNLGSSLDDFRHSTKTAVTDSIGTAYSYEQLFTLVAQVAGGLRVAGINPGDRVSIKLKNSIEFITAYYAVLRLGAVAVLVNIKLPATLVDYILNDSQAKLTIDEFTFASFVNQDTPVTEIAQVELTDPAVLMYTSGSTSSPKGVIIPHRRKLVIAEKAKFKYWPFRRIVIGAPCYHANGLSNLESALAGHATLIIPASLDVVDIADSITTHKANAISTVPTIVAKLLELPSADLTSLVSIVMASAPISKQLYTDLAERLPNTHIVNGYGITEAGPGLFGPHKTKPTPQASVGYPLEYNDYRIVDGILQVRTPSMLLGYNNMQSTVVTNDGYYITNDLFEIDSDGFYYFVGRADDMFTNGGNNVYPRQIEILLENHPAVKESAVIGIEDAIKGARPYAFVLLQGTVTEEELKNYTLENLPASHCPKKIWFLKSFPLSSVNKIDKTRLKEMANDLL